MRRGAAALALAGLAACAPAPPDKGGVSFRPDAGGLSVPETGQRVDFGRAPAGVIAPLAREMGPPDGLPLANCPEGIAQRLRWGGLELTFTDVQFVGWRQDGASAGQVCT
ncbi:hypothetical protein [Rhodovulum adriaticum]|uniref:Uncharacterized protein n=1 Tax=Rhodovulum adriaticum TaxID=35804 RepID=A0A4R2P0E2_RHOAD|nr:hypothetical protein [Rhodovulum adriaticum]MBK1636145.1 hypothetical protein [Rhodovulum adriaticum]TCP27528.1 hypothetical protein EV656_101436 [Rhodovulum adriaticum]